MTLLYDPKKQKAKPWVFILLIIIPIILMAVGWVISRKYVSEYQSNENLEATRDIFKEIK